MNLLSSHSLKKETVFIIDFSGISRVKGSVVQLVRMLPCHLALGETGSQKFF